MLHKALLIATRVHQDQQDRHGAPYLRHVLRVAERGRTDDERIVGLLHDVVEDSPMTLDDLRREGFPEHIVQAVDCLTKREGEPYDQFVDRTKTNRLAIAVKLNDLEDNMDVRRAPRLEEKDLERLNKYLKAWHQLVQLR
jgi:(p)ppGpp synthase/HD superfamily hydrolase